MSYQVYGAGVPNETVLIHALNVGGFLEIHVTGPDAQRDTQHRYNGLYYRAPAANIRSLTIRGTSDNETILIQGPLGLRHEGSIHPEGTVYVDGGAGNDVVVLHDSASPDIVSGYTLAAPDQVVYDAVWHHNGQAQGEQMGPRTPVYMVNAEHYKLYTGIGADTVRILHTPVAATFVGTEIITSAGSDTVTIGSDAPGIGLANVRGLVFADLGTGDLDALVFDNSTSNVAGADYSLSPSQQPGWTYILTRTVGGVAQPAFNFNAPDHILLNTGTQADIVRVSATPNIALGTSIATNGGDDDITVGVNGRGLDDILSVVNVDGGAGTNTLTANNRGAANNQLTLTSTPTSITRSDGKVINFANMSRTRAQAGGAANVNVQAVAAIPVVEVNLFGGGNTAAFGNGVFAVLLDGGPSGATVTSDGTGGDQVTLAGTLSVSLATGYAPAVGTVITILDNQTALPIVGTFDNLPEGAIVTAGGLHFQISYVGQSGANDVTLTVTANNPPVTNDETATTDEDTTTTIPVLANDTDADNDMLTVVATSGAQGTTTINPDGTITYTPDANWSGTDTFTYTIDDGFGGVVTATVTVTVNPINDAPVAANDSATAYTNGPSNIDVLTGGTDVDEDTLTITAVTQGTHGAVAVNDNGTPGDPSDDYIVYTPNTGWSGTDSFTYTISDGNGGTHTATITVTMVLPIRTSSGSRAKEECSPGAGVGRPNSSPTPMKIR